MKFSEHWLREWVDPGIDSASLQKQLTMAGLEIEGSSPVAAPFTGVVVGHVTGVDKHPDADKLRVCSVTDGSETYQVVCGAPNVRPGLRVPFAKVGARLSTELTIKRAKLRGVESNGMLCSAAELGLADNSEGLLELDAAAPAGTDIREYLNLDDVSIEINLTPNRGDCLSIRGLAREVGVLTQRPVAAPQVVPVTAVIGEERAVTLSAPAACPRYLGRVIRNISTSTETPLWMQEKLRRSGLRSIDPVVDVTNYVLLELGQPMHAFDLNKLVGGIEVRLARPGESLVLLDGREVTLEGDTLLIADSKRALAMAGIMGGKHSAVSPKTTDLFLESAFFEPLAIAGRARRHGLQTDAGYRYERGVDFDLPALAMERATELLLEIVGGEPGPVTVAEGAVPSQTPIRLRSERITALIGCDFAASEVEAILTSLGMRIASRDQGGWMIEPPSWRFDVSIEADLIEELARVRGYDNLPVRVPAARLALSPRAEQKRTLRDFRRKLIGLGYQEVVTFSFVDPALEEALGAGAKALVLANPISQDMSVMRTTLWPGLVTVLKHNQNRQQDRLKLFETGLTFLNKNNKLQQPLKVGCLFWGSSKPEQWSTPLQGVDFFDLKGDLEALLGLESCGLQVSFARAEHPALHPGQTAKLFMGGTEIGLCGALHPALMQALDIPGKVYVAELDFSTASGREIPVVRELSRFPAVRRDLALVLAEQIAAKDVVNLLWSCGGDALQDIIVFDVYQGQHIEKGKKSIALGLIFQHPSRTLVDQDIAAIIDSCIKALQAEFNAELR